MSSDKDIPSGYLYNGCYGGFSLSDECIELYEKETGNEVSDWNRTDPHLIKLFLEKGSTWISGVFSNILFREIPKELLQYVVLDEYDGMEDISISYSLASNKITEKFLKSVNQDESNLHEEYIKLKQNLKNVIEYINKL